MNHYLPSPHFCVHRHAQENAAPFALQQLHSPEIALRPAREALDSAHFQCLMARIRGLDGCRGLTRRQHRLIQIT